MKRHQVAACGDLELLCCRHNAAKLCSIAAEKLMTASTAVVPGPPLLNVEKVALVDGLEGRLHEAADWVEPRRPVVVVRAG